MYNKPFYDSTDYVVSISRVTEQIVKACSPDNFGGHIGHAVNSTFFKKLSSDEHIQAIKETKEQIINSGKFNDPKKKIFLWNNRKARRQQSGKINRWFKEWIDTVGHERAMI